LVSPLNVAMSSGGDTANVVVQNVGGGAIIWEAAVLEGDDWLAITGPKATGDGVLKVEADANADAASRTGVIGISALGALGSPARVTVTQSGVDQAVLLVSPTALNVSADAGAEQISVSNGGAGAMTWSAEVRAGADWLSLADESGSGDGAFTAQYSENTTGQPRSGAIRVEAPGVANSPSTITVTQGIAETPILSVSTDLLALGSAGGSEFVTVSNGGGGALDWSAAVVAGGEWMSIDTVKILGEGSITINYAQNAEIEPRSGIVSIKADGALGSPFTIVVEQSGAIGLSVARSRLLVGSRSGQSVIAVENVGSEILEWTVTIVDGADWLSADAVKVTGSGTITLSYVENNGEASRRGLARVELVSGGDSPIDIILAQTATSIIGDVDGSGTLDAVDIQLVINTVLQGGDVANADINADGSIDAVDVQIAINAALGLAF
jgi:hypothetical protein